MSNFPEQQHKPVRECTAFVSVWLMNLGTRERVERLCKCDMPEGHAGAHIVVGAS